MELPRIASRNWRKLADFILGDEGTFKEGIQKIRNLWGKRKLIIKNKRGNRSKKRRERSFSYKRLSFMVMQVGIPKLKLI
jgi:hypothetical protein